MRVCACADLMVLACMYTLSVCVVYVRARVHTNKIKHKKRTLSPTLKRKVSSALHSSKPLMSASLSSFRPMKTKRHSRVSPSYDMHVCV